MLAYLDLVTTRFCRIWYKVIEYLFIGLAARHSLFPYIQRYLTGSSVAQRKRVGLITQRSEDRNLVELMSILFHRDVLVFVFAGGNNPLSAWDGPIAHTQDSSSKRIDDLSNGTYDHDEDGKELHDHRYL
jgi:hypothetical protein